MTYNRLPVAMFMAALLSMGGPLAAYAPTAQAQESFSDDKIQSFAQAAVKLIDIRSQYQSQMNNASNDEERAQIQQQTNQLMTSTVEETPGISVQEYNQIAQESRSNEALAERINTYIKESAN